ncbi:GspH/FimT family pseudopilin [Halomonas caseinilytica]|uniref:Type II secretion system protein H n=1 Tax=Halomonas caseinilytica TaxID=438744 RepID=A0A1M6ZL14_9GAMM|nr:GspH/FimT family pseudopilin [Halomonas caseinilytica]SHL31053.1 type IV fimbrial biogenesis protein FimT [Halomonas caseinilytica]
MRPKRITETYHTGIPDSLAKPRQAGLTLLELCVVTGLLAFTVAWTAPRLDGFMARNEVTSDVMRLKEVLATARNAAIVRRTVITVCPSRDGRRCSDDWTMPLSILQGEVDLPPSQRTLLGRRNASQVPAIAYRLDHRPVRYQPTGHATGHNGTFRLCGRRGEGASVIVSNFGRVRVVDTTPPTC